MESVEVPSAVVAASAEARWVGEGARSAVEWEAEEPAVASVAEVVGVAVAQEGAAEA